MFIQIGLSLFIFTKYYHSIVAYYQLVVVVMTVLYHNGLAMLTWDA